MNCICPEPIGHRDAPQHCEWRRVPLDWSAGRYWVSSDGDAWGPHGLLAQFLKDTGRMAVTVYTATGQIRNVEVHRLVAAAFLPDWRPFRQTRFADGNPLNCRADNIIWLEPQPESVRYAAYRARKKSECVGEVAP